MTRTSQRLATAVIAVLATACNDLPSNPRSDALTAVSAAFSSVPLGFSSVTSSYSGDADGVPSLWLPGSRSIGFAGGIMMGGGIGDAFLGGIGRGDGFGNHGPFCGPLGNGLTCTGAFSAASNRFVCETITRDGLTVERSSAYTNAAGQVQQAFDSVTTNTVNVRTAVTGTVTYTRDTTSGKGRGPGHGHGFGGHIAGDTTTILTATTTVNHASDRTVTGLAQGSTQRTVNGASAGTEATTGTSSRGAFSSARSAADTTRGVIVALADGKPTYPTAGSVIRVMQATVTYAGQAAASSSRREVVTYDGSATAKVVIVQDGTTKNCTLPLPRGRLTCE